VIPAASLRGLYQDVLGRSLDEPGRAFWTGRLATISRQQVALEILIAREGLAQLVQQAYTQYLQRPADSGGLNYFISVLGAGGRYETIVASLAASSEYFNKQFGDHLAPTIVFQSPANGVLTNSNITVTGRVTDNLSGCRLAAAADQYRRTH